MTILERLRADLVTALREPRSLEASTIRTLIAAIENATAVEYETSVEPRIGLGHDQPRRDLSSDDITGIIEREWTEVSAAIAHYRRLGLTEELEDLGVRLRVIDRYRNA